MKRMTSDELRRAIETMGMTQVNLAKTIGMDPRTMRGWLASDSMIPQPAAILIRLMRDEIISQKTIDEYCAL